jgi:uncharacterized protein
MFSKINYIEFDMAGYCNLNCSYCYLEGRFDKKLLNIETVKKFFNLHMSSSEVSPYLMISFWGGEPLLNFEIIRFIVNLYNSEINKKIKAVSYQIITNGTLIDENIAIFCQKNNIILQITIDGDKNYHDQRRKYRNNKGTFERIINNIALLNRCNTSYHARVTLTAKSPSPVEIINVFKKNGIKNILFALLTPTKACTKDLYPVDSSAIISDLFWAYKDNNKSCYDKDIKYLNIIPILDIILNPSSKTTCGIEGKKIAIKYNGELYPCHRFINFHEYKIGNIWDENYDNPFEKISFKDDNSNCSICLIKDYCVGGCAFEILSRNDKNYIQYDYCKFRKGLLKNSLNILIESSRKNIYHLPLKYLLINEKINTINKKQQSI